MASVTLTTEQKAQEYDKLVEALREIVAGTGDNWCLNMNESSVCIAEVIEVGMSVCDITVQAGDEIGALIELGRKLKAARV